MRFKADLDRLVAEVRKHCVHAGTAREAAKVGDSNWSVYEDLLHESTALIKAQRLNSYPARVNILLPDARRQGMFAGVRTALSFACKIATALGWPIRVVSYHGLPIRRPTADWLENLARSELGYKGPRVELATVWDIDPISYSPLDYWIATYWTTAHSLDVACRAGNIDRTRVIYIVQDYEPYFYAGSTQSAIAQSTYHAGFHLVVNSKPLQTYLERREALEVPSGLVFRPEIDIERLAEASLRRSSDGAPVVGFYGRPSKPRNAFYLGIAALRAAERILRDEGLRTNMFSIGEPHKPVRIGNQVLDVRGKVSWNAYFRILAQTDVMFSLQQTPHPSHPPLDSVASGGIAVINEFEGTRAGLSPRLLTAPSRPDALGESIASAARQAITRKAPVGFDQDFVRSLGTPLDQVVRATLEILD